MTRWPMIPMGRDTFWDEAGYLETRMLGDGGPRLLQAAAPNPLVLQRHSQRILIGELQ
jgi:hypothetical protein